MEDCNAYAAKKDKRQLTYNVYKTIKNYEGERTSLSLNIWEIILDICYLHVEFSQVVVENPAGQTTKAQEGTEARWTSE